MFAFVYQISRYSFKAFHTCLLLEIAALKAENDTVERNLQKANKAVNKSKKAQVYFNTTTNALFMWFAS